MSRSYFTSIIPAEKSGEYFGIYDIFGKGAGCLGPALVSGCVILVQKLSEAFPSFTSITSIMNLDLLPIPLLTIAGFIVFYFAAKLPLAKEAIRAKKQENEEVQTQEQDSIEG